MATSIWRASFFAKAQVKTSAAILSVPTKRPSIRNSSDHLSRSSSLRPSGVTCGPASADALALPVPRVPRLGAKRLLTACEKTIKGNRSPSAGRSRMIPFDQKCVTCFG
jgi:hypothetical protein